MTSYTVHLPPESGDPLGDVERAVFIPDRFSWGAFFLGPLWLIGNRVWFALAAWVLVVAALGAVASATHPTSSLEALAMFLVALFFGFEARHFLRLQLGAFGYRFVEVIAAGNQQEAEHAFYRRWAEAPPPPRPAPPTARPQPKQEDVLGLFPEAGGRA